MLSSALPRAAELHPSSELHGDHSCAIPGVGRASLGELAGINGGSVLVLILLEALLDCDEKTKELSSQ